MAQPTKKLAHPYGKAGEVLEQRRAAVLAELERIAAEVRAYATSGRVDYGHAGDLGAVLEGLSTLHLVGAAHQAEAAPARGPTPAALGSASARVR